MIFDLLDQIGNCQLYHDYRSGSFRDWSENGHSGTPSSGGVLNRYGFSHGLSSELVIPGSTDLSFTSENAATITAYFPDGFKQNDVGINYIITDASGGNGLWLTDTVLYCRVNGVTSFRSLTSQVGMRYFSATFKDGDFPDFVREDFVVYTGNVTQTKAGSPFASNYYIGTTSSSLRQLVRPIGVVLMFFKALSVTEHAELFAALEGVRWPSKVYSHARNPQTIDADESGLVLGCDMRAVGGKVVDVSGNNDPGTVNTTLTVRGALGDALEFNDVDSYVEFADDPSLDVTDNFTFSAWVKTDSALNEVVTKWTTTLNQRSFGFVTSAGKLRLYMSSNGSTYENQESSGAIDSGTYRHIGFALSGGKIRFYIDGQFDVERTYLTHTSVFSGSSPLRFGDVAGGAIAGELDGQMIAPKIHNVVKSDDWFLAEYAKGAKTVQFKTSWGARETSAAVASGNITNTPFEVISGTFDIVTTTINGKLTKALKCITAGVCAMPTSVFKTGYTEAAFGTFDFWVYHETAVTRIVFISDTAGILNSYDFRIAADESLKLLVYPGAAVVLSTDVGYVNSGEWNRFRITRAINGDFTIYMNGVLVDVTGGIGTNPLNDTTNVESKFVVFDLDAGDMIALGALDGSYNFKKRLGVYNG